MYSQTFNAQSEIGLIPNGIHRLGYSMSSSLDCSKRCRLHTQINNCHIPRPFGLILINMEHHFRIFKIKGIITLVFNNAVHLGPGVKMKLSE